MRVVDPYEDRFNPERDWRSLHKTKKRRKKRQKPQRLTDYFLKVRCKVPVEPSDDLVPPYHQERYVDDWAPNLRGPEGRRDEVEVTVLGWRKFYYDDAAEPAFRVCVWGGDDLGYERDFHFTETTPEWLVKMVLDFPEPLTKDYLIEQVGMWPA
jgi:hypothetical protein